jgi:hypothetical protein
MEVHWLFNVLREYPPPPLSSMVLAQASTATLMEGVLELMSWPSRFVATLRTTEGFGGLTPSILGLMSCFILKSSQVPYKPLVSPLLYGLHLPRLCFP